MAVLIQVILREMFLGSFMSKTYRGEAYYVLAMTQTQSRFAFPYNQAKALRWIMQV